MKIMTNSIVFVLFTCLYLSMGFSFDLSQTDKHGQVLSQESCNKDTVIDLRLSPDTVLSSCSLSGCTLSNAQSSTLRFLNMAGQEQTYTLINATIFQTSGGVSRPQQKGIFEFGFQNNGKWVMMAVPFSNTIVNSSQSMTYELNLTNDFDPSLSFLREMTNQANNSTGVPLSSFNFLNQLEYEMFYHVADSSVTVTYLLSYFILSNMKINPSSFQTIVNPFPPVGIDYQATGDKLCWGSISQGVFQTHMRQSYPLWTAWFSIFIFWIYYMTTDLILIQCFDRKFENNKWTCWSIYSLHNLAHEEFFTFLTRQTMMLITFCWQALILGVLYSNITYGQHPVMILWAAIIAVATALPFPYVLGYFFLSKIYEKSLQKFDVMKRMHGLFNKKEGLQPLERQLDDIEETLYGLYYWYYVIAFVFFTAFWIITVHQMMQLPRQFYYLHRYWLASLGVAFGLEHLIIDPLMTFVFGNFRFYRIRGYYYDYQLGERFKQLEQ